MTRAIYITAFDCSLATWPDSNGNAQIACASRVGPVPLPDVTTNLVLIDAPAAVHTEMQATGDYMLVEVLDG